jgi:DNA-binding CsgD family transcriptional regulator
VLEPQALAAPRPAPVGGDGQTIVVIDLGGRLLPPDRMGALEDVLLPHARAVVITDGPPPAPTDGARQPDILWPDLAIGEQAARAAFRAYGGQGAFDELVRLGGDLAGGVAASGPVLADFFEEVVERRRELPESGLRRATGQHLAAVVERTMPHAGARLMALFSVSSVLPESVVRRVVDDPHEYEQFRALAERGLIRPGRGEGGGLDFGVAEELQETLRRTSSLSYAQSAAAIHGWAAEAAAQRKDFPEAIGQYLRAGRHEAATRVFAEHWDHCVQHDGAARTRALSMALPAESVFASAEAVAAVWLVHAISPGTVPRALHQTRLLGLGRDEIAQLSTRGRVSVRTARALMLLHRGSPLDAEGEIRRASPDAVTLAGADAVGSEGLIFAYRLTRARIALWQGDLGAASRQFGEIGEDLAHLAPGVFAFLAVQGRMLADALRGEFDVAESLLPQVEALCAELKLADTRLGAELWYAVIRLRDNEAAEVGLREARQAIRRRRGADDSWRHLRSYLDILLLVRKGDWAQAGQALRALSRSRPPARQELPLFDAQLRALLGVVLIASDQAGAALELVAGEPDGTAHLPCYSTVRAVALVTQGAAREAIEATEACVHLRDHAAPSIVHAQLARAMAFTALGLPESAQQAYLNALGAMVAHGVRADLRMFPDGYLDELDRSAQLLAPRLAAGARGLIVRDSGTGREDPGRAPRGFADLSTPEWETLRLLAGGQSLSEIAATHYLNRNTLKSRTRSLYRKLGVASRQEAVDLAVRQGVIRPGGAGRPAR